ncbi:hypothetical protein MARINOS108_140061 [Marinoscillum sp. 108]|nr:hypothetical protein MARINOS108_140061 [Marinoscillum sp. 108]
MTESVDRATFALLFRMILNNQANEKTLTLYSTGFNHFHRPRPVLSGAGDRDR